ncbi:unnamed protein product [Brassica oleracea var. botrytis]|uniref:Uncharacterized protein n=2 Tax=Brassica TaxID=3705 RepID=A0A3P6CLB3_BRAOL|nr:unnamed protein product [Brassica napus]VDD16366.1 unnamed protein product [Brassica oleracea]
MLNTNFWCPLQFLAIRSSHSYMSRRNTRSRFCCCCCIPW